MSIADYAMDVLKRNNPGRKITTGGFYEAIRRVTKDGMYKAEEYRFHPDAYAVDKGKKEIHVYEIEDTSTITREKLKSFAWLWFCLDADEWDLYLHIHDRYGNHRCDVDLCTAYNSFFLTKANPL